MVETCPLCKKRLMIRHAGPLHLYAEDISVFPESNVSTENAASNTCSTSSPTNDVNINQSFNVSNDQRLAVSNDIENPDKENIVPNYEIIDKSVNVSNEQKIASSSGAVNKENVVPNDQIQSGKKMKGKFMLIQTIQDN